MARNVALFVSSAAVLILAYVVYTSLVHPGPGEPSSPSVETAMERLPPAPSAATQPGTIDDDVLEIGPARIPAGEGISFVVYDRFGNPTETFRAERWQKVAGTEREIAVVKPEIAMVLPSGLTATIRAEQGQFTAERAQEQKFEPKTGVLTGEVRIDIDRSSEDGGDERDPLCVATDRLHFDLQVGELRTDGPIQVTSDLFDIAGEGFRLVWSRQANRVETLTIDRGRHLTLYVQGGVFGAMGDAEAVDGAAPAASRPQPTTSPGEPSSRPRPRRLTSYFCVLDGGIVAEHDVSGQRRGGLAADELRVWFDIGGGADRLLHRAGDNASTRRSARESGERLVVRWSGKLSLAPTPTPARLLRPRRQLEAIGREVVVDLDDRRIVCGKLTYHDETGRLWLSPVPGRRIDLALGARLTAEAENIFVDRPANVVKLIGEVLLWSQSGDRGEGGMRVRCSQFAELRLTKAPPPATATSQPASAAADGERASASTPVDPFRGTAAIESAAFAGRVRVDLNEQALRADRLEAFFRAAQDEEPLEQLLQRVVASGEVRLTAGTSSELPRWIEYLVQKWERPLRAVEDGGAAEQSLECGHLELLLDHGADGRAFARAIHASGAVGLRDRGQSVSARGKRLAASLDEGNRLLFATVYGSESDPARLRADEYTILGSAIEFDPVAETMRVPGSSRLTFTAERGLRGERRSRAEPITVSCTELLQADNKNNVIDFRGRVVAVTGDERLRADALTLHLEAVAPAAPAPASPTWATVLHDVRSEVAGPSSSPAVSVDGGRATRAAPRLSGGRKEPLRLVARNAGVTSELTVAGDPQPLVHQSIEAPELDIDIRKRAIHTVGLTTLLMIDRRLPSVGDEASARDAIGLPSALVSRGPSQTALQCRRSMTYALGPEGPARRDSVIFEGDVVFRHVAGREMANLEQLFPTQAHDPQFLGRLKDRDNLLTCDRLEGTFEMAEEHGVAEGGGVAGRTPMRMTWLNARGSVYLVDKQGPVRREVLAEQLEFDRPNQLVRVLGDPSRNVDARVMVMNAEANRFDQPAVGPEFLIDLKNNTLKAGRFDGVLQRR